MTKDVTRREFLKKSSRVAVGVGLGIAASKSVRAQKSANERIILGVIGTGGRGSALIRAANRCPDTEISAVCDVYDQRANRARNAAGEKAKVYSDYRQVLDRKDIDAVIIATPDHWHHDIFIDAVQAGKDIYCEKPMSKTIEQGKEMVKVARAAKRVVQIGTNRRAGKQYPQAKELIEKGKLGKIRFARAYDCRNYTMSDPFHPSHPRNSGYIKDGKLKGNLDWKKFLGPAPPHKFDLFRFFAWRWYWDYAGGLVTDVGVHVMDVVHWLTGKDTPRSAVCCGGTYELKYWETPDVVNAVFDYGTHSVALTFNFCNAYQGNGLMIYGTDATLEVRGGDIYIFPERNRSKPEITIKAAGSTYEHVQNFLDCVRSRKEPYAPVELGYRSLLPSLLANIAYRERKMVTWDAEKEEIAL